MDKVNDKVFTKISWDWKLGQSEEELREALEPFGIEVYDDQDYQGTDCYGFIFSSEPLDDNELELTSERYEPEEGD